jgi:hypothetical protein
MRSPSTDLCRTRTSSWPTPSRTSWPVSNPGVTKIIKHLNLAPKLPSNKDKDFLKKKNYGKVPKYVTKIKDEIEEEYNLVREMQIEEQNERDR